jgi:large subunit ribosomal protein L23
MNYYDLIKYPVHTEKTSKLTAGELDGIEAGRSAVGATYTFIVDKKASKDVIKAAVEKVFEVKVASVNTLVVKPKSARRGKYTGFKAGYKKAFVTLTKDSAEIKNIG